MALDAQYFPTHTSHCKGDACHSQETCPASRLAMGAASAAVRSPGKLMTVSTPQTPDDAPSSPRPSQDPLRVGFNPSLCDLNPTQRPHLHLSNVPQPPGPLGTIHWDLGCRALTASRHGRQVSGPASRLPVTDASDTVRTEVAGLQIVLELKKYYKRVQKPQK